MPTTQISLIREHTETIKPPRAMWVPFEFGRPLGLPGDANFQSRVLIDALKLLDAPTGPVLTIFQEDAEVAHEGSATLACPVDFYEPAADLSDVAKLRAQFRQEIAHLRPWFDLALKTRGRTTVGASGLEPDTLGVFVSAFLDGIPPSPREDIFSAPLLKLAAEDLKAYYFEAVTAQPGQATSDSKALSGWFWRETTAGRVLFAIQETHESSQDQAIRSVCQRLLVPAAHIDDSPYRNL